MARKMRVPHKLDTPRLESIFDDLSVPLDRTGIVIVDHGSRREESNEMLMRLVEEFKTQSPFSIVEPAHMELAKPTIEDAFGACVGHGAELVVVHPYFLFPGRHWKADIPRLAAAASANHSGVRHLVTAPLGLHAAMLDIIHARIAERLGEYVHEGGG